MFWLLGSISSRYPIRREKDLAAVRAQTALPATRPIAKRPIPWFRWKAEEDPRKQITAKTQATAEKTGMPNQNPDPNLMGCQITITIQSIESACLDAFPFVTTFDPLLGSKSR